MLTITNEDNMELMSRYPDKYFDLAIVDPPYGIEIAEWDIKENKPNKEYFNELIRVSKNWCVWGANYFKIIDNNNFIVWDKKPFLKTQSQSEIAFCNFKTNADVFRYQYAGNFENGKVDYNKKSIHPTQKPVALYKWLLDKYAKQGDKILDTHLGSGSIAIACHDYGFDLTACELDKEYFEKAMIRINNHINQQKLF